MPDLLEIGDGANIGYGADLEPFVVEDGWLYLAPIRVGARAFIGSNAVVMLGGRVGADACVGEQSLVARDQVIPPAETWVGSPSRKAEPDVQLEGMKGLHDRPRWSAFLLCGFACGFLLLEILPWLMLAPGLLLLSVAAGGTWWQKLAALPLAGTIFVLSACLVIAIGKRLAMPRAHAGVFPLRSWLGLRKWFTDKLMLLSLAATNSLYATLYTAPWLRLLGAGRPPRRGFHRLEY